ncbi:unnamed protein product [Adineta ricciae]|uniref:Uncharacterized protein n=1 Tax=Adineta ricciae TaxID=249248 RepID=A0A816DC10_ADIRI|nr:unnamed protein product [Adineta ricciae]CAF1634343.1 unnamed protein product [Adineta ricciae]
MHKITVVNQNVVKTQKFDSGDFEFTEHATGKQQNMLLKTKAKGDMCNTTDCHCLRDRYLHFNTDKTAAATTTGTRTATATITGTEPATTTFMPGPISMAAVDRHVYGVCNTSAGADSVAANAGEWRCQYMARESPDKACDGYVSTKYLSFGSCHSGGEGPTCGTGTGFYLELSRGPTLVNGMKVCTADDFEQRDPIHASLEGSSLSGRDLSLGSSWTLLYGGSSGLETDPGRKKCGPLQLFNNTKEYRSYRFLVSAKRNISNCVQYSEVQLYSL